MEFETITNELYKSGELKLLSSVSPNWKHGQTNKLMKGTYVNEYNSQKYSDRSTLRSLAMNFNSYLVFEYLRYQDTNRISESIYCSYPHLADLQAFFINAVNFINGILAAFACAGTIDASLIPGIVFTSKKNNSSSFQMKSNLTTPKHDKYLYKFTDIERMFWEKSSLILAGVISSDIPELYLASKSKKSFLGIISVTGKEIILPL